MAGGGTASYLLPVATILIHVLFPPFLFVLGITILLASFGKSLGIRKVYVRALIRIFDFTRKLATEAEQKNRTTQISYNNSSGCNGGSHISSEYVSKSYDEDTCLKSDGLSTNLNQKLNVEKDLHDQIDSGVDAGYDLPTGSFNLDQCLKTSPNELCSNDVLYKQSINGEINFHERGGNPDQQHNKIQSETSTCDVKPTSDTSSDDLIVKNNDVAYLRQRLRGMGRESRHNVISRKDNLILSPDKPPGVESDIIKSVHEEVDEEQFINTVSDSTTKEMANLGDHDLSSDSFHRDFGLDDVCPYIKTGIASIIEDEVTQRFVAEELKSWNLLTRTSQSFEFVNLRLTIIWIIGFIFRYCFLLPGRILILGVGLSYLMTMTAFIGLLPWIKLRNILYKYAAKVSFRIMARAVSADVSFHNRQYKAKNDGICVANHSTPWDAVMLSCDNTYALISWLSICMAFVGHLPDSNVKRTLHYHVYTSCFQILGGSLSAVITYHNAENKPKRGICVANHTSPIDVMILACDNAYALIGQMHGGFLGQFQSILSKCSDHIWFERSESKDRALITDRLREHVQDPDKLPILIFPEGTCINNTSVMQFKKGSFEVGGTIYPVAIKYDPLFGDAFWNSSKHGMVTYIYLMMTSWAIVCDVWYLPPMTKSEDEDAVTFANRVKAEIARQGGLVDLMWDGNLKRSQVKSEWKGKQQQAFAERIKMD